MEVPVRSAPKRSAARPTPTAVLRPSSATAIPMKPICDTWTSSTPRRCCQPTMSRPPASPANAPRDRERDDEVPADADASVARCLRVVADRAHLVAERRPVEHEVEDDECGDRDEDPRVQRLESRVPPDRRELRAVGDVVGDRDRLVEVVLQRAVSAEQVAAAPVRDPVEHDRRDHLVRADRRLEEAGDPAPAPRRPAPRAVIASRTCGTCAMSTKREPTKTAVIAPDDVLALSADVEEAAAEREGDREPGEDQRRRRQQRLREVVRRGVVRVRVPPEPDVSVRERDVDVVVAEVEEPVQTGALEDRLVGRERVVAGCERRRGRP